MVLKVIDNPCEYSLKKLCTVFFPFEKITDSGDSDIEVTASMRGDTLCVAAKVGGRENMQTYELKQDDDTNHCMTVLLYNVLSTLTGYRPPWGILFGVRPAKLMHSLTARLGEQGAREELVSRRLVSPDKAELVAEVAKHENRIISLSQRNSYSLYVSIPFCPTRCSYCSFVSHSVEKTQKLLAPYTDLLCRELVRISEVASSLGLRLETIYFGGGTPTTLSADSLAKLFDTISASFDLSGLREYTVEAGRPDTVTEEKLLALKTAGVTRISINPQTFNDRVLEAIGRRHTAAQTVTAFELARRLGFDNINMDLIAGLPLDDMDSFKSSVNTAADMGADSVTVHTLALKSASNMVTGDSDTDLSGRFLTADMVGYADTRLPQSGYYPYYMYRQSKSFGNLENVGWCKVGRECLYNVFMMDETHSVLAAGAGGVTRLRNPDTGHIDRIYNYKYPYEYIDSFDEVIQRKHGIIGFYSE